MTYIGLYTYFYIKLLFKYLPTVTLDISKYLANSTLLLNFLTKLLFILKIPIPFIYLFFF